MTALRVRSVRSAHCCSYPVAKRKRAASRDGRPYFFALWFMPISPVVDMFVVSEMGCLLCVGGVEEAGFYWWVGGGARRGGGFPPVGWVAMVSRGDPGCGPLSMVLRVVRVVLQT